MSSAINIVFQTGRVGLGITQNKQAMNSAYRLTPPTHMHVCTNSFSECGVQECLYDTECESVATLSHTLPPGPYWFQCIVGEKLYMEQLCLWPL